jgi:hypothetical protein
VQPTLQKVNSYALLPSLDADMSEAESVWTPGKPVLTGADQAKWLAWRSNRRREQQRERRARLRRIDYHASIDTAMALERMWRPSPGHDFSSILDRIVREWLTSLPPE